MAKTGSFKKSGGEFQGEVGTSAFRDQPRQRQRPGPKWVCGEAPRLAYKYAVCQHGDHFRKCIGLHVVSDTTQTKRMLSVMTSLKLESKFATWHGRNRPRLP
jgi:hypothetical protein